MAKRGRPRRAAPAQSDFYGPAFTEELRHVLAEARAVEGLSEEIALLRVRVRELVVSGATDAEVGRAIDVLTRAITASGRLPVRDASATMSRVSEELAGILELLAEQAVPGEAG